MGLLLGIVLGVVVGFLCSLLPGVNIGLFYLLGVGMPTEMAIGFIVSAEAISEPLKVLRVINPELLDENDKVAGAINKVIAMGYGGELIHESFFNYCVTRIVILGGGIILLLVGQIWRFNLNDYMVLALILVPVVWILFISLQEDSNKSIRTLVMVVVYAVVGYSLIHLSSGEGSAPMFTVASSLYGIPTFFDRKKGRVKIKSLNRVPLTPGQRPDNKYGYYQGFMFLGMLGAIFWGLPSSLLTSTAYKVLEKEGIKSGYGIKEIVSSFILQASSSTWGLIFCLGNIGARSAAASTLSIINPNFLPLEGVILLSLTLFLNIEVAKNIDYLAELYRKIINDWTLSDFVVYVSLAISVVSVMYTNTIGLFILVIGLALNKLRSFLQVERETSLAAISIIPLLNLI